MQATALGKLITERNGSANVLRDGRVEMLSLVVGVGGVIEIADVGDQGKAKDVVRRQT